MSRLLTGIKYHIKNSYPFHIKIYSDGITLYTELNVIDIHHDSHQKTLLQNFDVMRFYIRRKISAYYKAMVEHPTLRRLSCK